MEAYQINITVNLSYFYLKYEGLLSIVNIRMLFKFDNNYAKQNK